MAGAEAAAGTDPEPGGGEGGRDGGSAGPGGERGGPGQVWGWQHRLGSGELVRLPDPRLQHRSSVTAPGVTRTASLRHLSGQLLLGAF